MMRKKPIICASAAAVVLIGCAMTGPMMSQVEQPEYTVVASDGAIELRAYNPQIVAEVQVDGQRKDAINGGFKLLADFIFGNNTAESDIAMTAPVKQQRSEKIAMTAPVKQQQTDDGWSVRFVMPAEYTMDSLPKPNNDKVTIKEIAGKRFAAIRFSGIGSDDNIAEHEEKLKSYIADQKLESLAAPVYAFYNPPWTLPFWRRNEVMIEVQ